MSEAEPVGSSLEGRDPGIRIHEPLAVVNELLKYDGATPESVLRNFLLSQAGEPLVDEVLGLTDGIAHIGVEVRTIESGVQDIQQAFGQSYHLDGVVDSAGIPRRFQDSVGRIRFVNSNSPENVSIEIFEVKWGGKLMERNAQIKGRDINHVALKVAMPSGVADITSRLSERKGISMAIEPTANHQTKEVFSYLQNQDGQLIEFVYQPETEMTQKDERLDK